MRVAVILILLSYCRMYLVAYPYPYVLLPFVGGGELVCLLSVYRDGGDLTQTKPHLIGENLLGIELIGDKKV